MKKWFNNICNKIHDFFVKYEAIITVILGVVFFPILMVSWYMSLVTPLALEELGFTAIENYDIYNPTHITYLSAGIGAFALMWWSMSYICDLASAINALIHGKKSRVEEKKNDI